MTDPAEIEIHVNGQPRAVAAGSTVAMLLQTLELDPRTLAVEREERREPRSPHRP